MAYALSDSSGTDDDLPPSNRNRFQGRIPGVGNGKNCNNVPMVHSDMETQIHDLEQDAYFAVLRAFKAQSDAITWEQESLITELRKELRVSDEEHRVLLSKVNVDDVIRRIREWRKARGSQPRMHSTSIPVNEGVPSPPISASHKKQKTLHSVTSLSTSTPTPALHTMVNASGSNVKHGLHPGSKNKKQKSFPFVDSGGRKNDTNHNPSDGFGRNEAGETTEANPLIGRKVWTRWPEDNNFYEAVISNYNPVEREHALVYDLNTPKETWEWVNLAKIPPRDIRWDGEDPKIQCKGTNPASCRENKKPLSRGGAAAVSGRGRGSSKGHSKELPLPHNGVLKKEVGDIEILHTDTLIKQIERVFSSSHPDPSEVDKSKKLLREHEQALVDAIARLEGASDGESDNI